MTATAHWTDRLRALRACSEAVAWAEPYATADEAWAVCARGDWMLWWAGREAGAPWSDARRPLTLAACACARLALPHVIAGEDRPRIAIETAESWARGEGATQEDVLAAWDAAGDAAWDAAGDAAWDAAWAAAGAAWAAAGAAAGAAWDAAGAAAGAAWDAAGAAWDAAGAAWDAAGAAWDAAWDATIRACADIVRRHYPHPPTLEAGL